MLAIAEDHSLSKSPPLKIEGLSPLWKRALDAAGEGITISDVSLPDNPIVYANRGFERITRYRAKEVLGRNCRFLQGHDTDPEAVAEVRRAVRAGRECTVELLNYRKDGAPFWNRLSIRPLHNARGEVSHFIGIQTDVSRRRRAEEEARRANRELELAYEGLRANLEAGAKIQRALLPARLPSIDGLEMAWVFEPCEELAGDSLDVMQLDKRHLALYMLDVSGHGLPAALLSVGLSRQLSAVGDESILLSEDRAEGDPGRVVAPSRVLERLNRQFPFDPKNPQFFTMFYGVLDVETLRLRYASAGHPPAVVVPSRGETRTLEADGLPVGLFPDAVYADREARLRPGDRLVLHTDGVTETPDGDGEEFGFERLVGRLEATREGGLEDGLSGVVTAVEAWASDSEIPDDLSLLGVEVKDVRRFGRQEEEGI